MSFKVIEGYKFDKRIFRLSFLLMLILFLVAWGSYGFPDPLNPPVYVSCPETALSWCENPFFDGVNSNVGDLTYFNPGVDIKDISHIPPNYTYGQKPPFIIKNMGYFFLVILIFSFVMNHKKNNKELIK